MKNPAKIFIITILFILVIGLSYRTKLSVIAAQKGNYQVKIFDIAGEPIEIIEPRVNAWLASQDAIAVDSIIFDSAGGAAFIITYHKSGSGTPKTRINIIQEDQPNEIEKSINGFVSSLDASQIVRSINFGPSSTIYIVYE